MREAVVHNADLYHYYFRGAVYLFTLRLSPLLPVLVQPKYPPKSSEIDIGHVF